MKRDFLDVTDFTEDEIQHVLGLALDLKRKQKKGKAHPLLKGKTLAMIFQKPSTRTRISFETGMFQLGGHAIYISPGEMGLGQRETVPDVARVLSRYNDGIMARVFGHDIVSGLADHASIPVINGLPGRIRKPEGGLGRRRQQRGPFVDTHGHAHSHGTRPGLPEGI
jgi:ornithine carbamoyltransferase